MSTKESKQTPSCAAGFTLAELLVTMAISFVLGSAGFLFFRGQLRSLTDQSAGLDAIEGARAALDFMANEIRMAGANPAGTWPQAGTCGAGLSSAQTNRLTVSWDGANGRPVDGNIDANESITYRYDSAGKRIWRSVNGVDTMLIGNAVGLTLQYFKDASAAAMSGGQVTSADCNGVTNIQITVQVQAARATTVTNVNLGARVALRNRVLAKL
jgi:prepilin-type N-terminal cleavage/methylation domain-containing protein